MINVIPKRIMVAGGVVLLLVLALYLADKNGYTRAVADYSVEAAELAEESRKKQAIEQIAVNDLADQFYKAQENEREKSIEVDALKRALRERDSRASNSDAFNSPIYRMHNVSADNPDLHKAVGTKEPDAEGDGIEVVQYSVAEYNRVAVKVNTLIDIISQSECFN